jgi:hypothetical protein
MVPRPGPTFPRDDAEALIAVSGSRPVMASIIDPARKIKI